MDRKEVFAALKEKGVSRAVATFYGGNDEGHVDDISYFDINGEVDKTIDRNELEEEISDPVYDHYGGFGGDFSVSGECIWTVEDEKVVLDVEESEMIPHIYEISA